jgi:hypothetical protein
MSGYEGDSFFTLSTGGRIGLLTGALLMAIGSLFLSRYLGRQRSFIFRFLTAVGTFWIFLWISPQFFYAYYMTLFADLPAQIVIKWPDNPKTILALLTFSDRSNLSNHTKAILGWLLILHSIFAPKRRFSVVSQTSD